MSVLIREVSIRRDEFIRHLPEAAGNFSYEVNGNDILMKNGERRVDIKLVYEGTAEMGERERHVHQVHFVFTNMSDEQARAFMEQWDFKKLRTGEG